MWEPPHEYPTPVPQQSCPTPAWTSDPPPTPHPPPGVGSRSLVYSHTSALLLPLASSSLESQPVTTTVPDVCLGPSPGPPESHSLACHQTPRGDSAWTLIYLRIYMEGTARSHQTRKRTPCCHSGAFPKIKGPTRPGIRCVPQRQHTEPKCHQLTDAPPNSPTE